MSAEVVRVAIDCGTVTGRSGMLEDIRLLWGLQRGDKEALRRIYERHQADLLTLACCGERRESLRYDALCTSRTGTSC